MFLNYLNGKVSFDNENVICPKIERINDDGFVCFFNEAKWSVKISISMLNEAWEKKEILKEKFLRLAIRELLVQHKILDSNTVEKTIVNYSVKQTGKEFGRGIMNKTNTQALVIFINGERKSGKTTLLTQMCSRKDGNEHLWLDFNGVAVDFSEVILKLVEKKYTRSSRIKIILDNLECCGYDKAKNILSFFTGLITILQKQGKQIQLFVIEDKEFCLSKFYNNKDSYMINVSKKETLLDCCESNQESSEIGDYKFVNSLSHTGDVFSMVTEGLDLEQKKMLLKIVVLISYGIRPRLCKDEIAIVKNIIANNRCCGLKLFDSKHVTYYDKEFCKKFLDDYSENGGIFDECYKDNIQDYKREIFIEYCEENDLSFTDIIQVLTNETCDLPAGLAKKFIDLLELAQKLTDEIERDVILKKNNNMIMENHMGSILFAAETLSYYAEDDWKALAAWKEIAEHINNVFYIDGQRLPEVRIGQESMENTFLDFEVKNFDCNSIVQQIRLQNEVLEKYDSDFNEEQINDLKDENFCYLLSELQKENEEIDINRFYHTYILSLLFEFEVTAPKSQINNKKIRTLFKKIVLNAQTKNEEIYFYPARVPWVTARMLLAFCAYKEIEPDMREDYNKLKSGMCRWLERCNISFGFESNRYRIWTAGTGKWNSVLETTMMCTFALSEAGGDKNIITEGTCYINKQKDSWFSPGSIADGIWAYQTICMANQKTRDMFRISEIRDYLNSYFLLDMDVNKKINIKNDKSLGKAHIAKTLVSILDDFTDSVKGIIIKKNTSYTRYTNSNYSFKIGVTFTGKNRERVKAICDGLLAEGYMKKDIFYDEWHGGLINGINGDLRIGEIYAYECECIVVFLSEDYSENAWAGNIEWRAVRSLINNNNENRICLLKVDNVDVESVRGLYKGVDIIDYIGNKDNHQVVKLIQDFYTARVKI